MRSLFSFGASKEMSIGLAGSGHRLPLLRHKTLANNSRITIALSALATPFAVFGMVNGAPLPLILSAMGLAGGMLTLALHQRRMTEQAAMGQVLTMLGMGLALTVLDPAMIDAGLAIAVLAPVLAALMGGESLRRQSWLMLAGVVAFGALASVMPVPAPSGITLSAALSLLASVVVVLHTASRLGGANDGHDKAQASAYRHLVENAQDAMLRFSSAGDVVMASHSSETLFGCRRFQLTGNGLIERVHVADRPNFLTAFSDANIEGKSRVIEVRMRHDDPRATVNAPIFLWIEVSLSPIVEADGAASHEVVALLRDITKRKDSEAAMAEARQAAEDALASKSKFLATIGHELRTPLNAVVGFSEMMTTGIGGELSETHREYAGLIHQSGKHLLEVVRMLLDMARLDAGKFDLQAEPFAAHEIIEPCFGMVDAMARERGVTLVADVGNSLPMLFADERACRQILLNLLSNAIKFSNPQSTVTVTLKRQGTSLNLSVRDQGIGMAPESLERVGEAFFQAQSGLTRGYEGTGLGLSIVKGLVDLHQGTLRAMSEIGAGTTVTVLLPINGPAIKSDDTATVTPIRKEPAAAPISSWQDEKRKAQ